MSDNSVNTTFSTDDQETVMAAIAEIRQKLPFLISLTSDGRRGLSKLGDKSQAFVTKALNIAAQNPAILPGSFKLETLRGNWQLFQLLEPIRLQVGQLHSLVEDTSAATGSDAFAAARTVYAFTKVNPGAPVGPGAGELAQRFARKTRASDPPVPTTETAPNP